MQRGDGKLTDLARSVVEPMGYELVGVEHVQRGKAGAILRIYIDREQGITLDDSSAVSHQLSGLLDVEDPISGHYDLEVSSPGLDRPLFTAAHFERFRGCKARLKLAEKLEGRRNFEGRIAGASGSQVFLEVDGETRAFALVLIESARLIPEF